MLAGSWHLGNWRHFRLTQEGKSTLIWSQGNQLVTDSIEERLGMLAEEWHWGNWRPSQAHTTFR